MNSYQCLKCLGYRHNPDETIRKLEREYAASPSDENRDRLNAARERAGLSLIPRVFLFSEGWQAQTKFIDGRVISSATVSHDGWWGIDHVTWTQEDPDIKELGHHVVTSVWYSHPESGGIWNISFAELRKPTKEEVEEAHQEVLHAFKRGDLPFYVDWTR